MNYPFKTDMDEFVKKLSVETPLSHAYSLGLIETILGMGGDFDDAKIIYDNDGLAGLLMYVNQLRASHNLLANCKVDISGGGYVYIDSYEVFKKKQETIAERKKELKAMTDKNSLFLYNNLKGD